MTYIATISAIGILGLLIALPAQAQSVVIDPDGSGGFVVDADETAVPEILGGAMRFASGFGKAVGAHVDPGSGIDFAEPHVVLGPLGLRVERPDGTVSKRDLNGAVMAFDKAKTFTETPAETGVTYTLDGALVFRGPDKELRMEQGAITLVKR